MSIESKKAYEQWVLATYVEEKEQKAFMWGYKTATARTDTRLTEARELIAYMYDNAPDGHIKKVEALDWLGED
jgi:hypothetical protein